MKTKKSILSLIVLIMVVHIQATVLPVPDSFPTIQAAINASADGDTIAVSPGSYFENINFRGKKVLLTSLFYLASDTSFISSTIINGSTPVDPDTASCVIFNSGEDANAILQGFTITGGAGTKWNDIHGAGLFREGGGILIELSSPTIRYNKITENIVTNTSGVTSTGGGGLRIGDSNPTLCGNLISHNQARYGAGIVLNYTGCKITNNIIVSNTGGEDFHGGSAIWIAGDLGSTPKIIENNTIVDNTSALASNTGGISVWFATNVIIRNNIIWGNLPALQIKTISATPQVNYSDVQGGFPGAGNLDLDPAFELPNYILSNDSPCIDAGDTASVFNDIEDIELPGYAIYPSKGLLRNDMGAYGGPCTSLIHLFQTTTAIQEFSKDHSISLFPNPFSTQSTLQFDMRLTEANLMIYNSYGQKVKQVNKISNSTFTLSRDELPDGLYFLCLIKENKVLATTKFIITKN